MARQVAATPYLWPRDGSVDPSTTALVIIDMQHDFCSPGGYLDLQGFDVERVRSIIPRVQQLLHTCREKGCQVYHTRQGHRPDLSTFFKRWNLSSSTDPTQKGIGDVGPLGRLLVRGQPGHDTIPELYPIDGEPVIDKPGTGAFAHTEFELILRLRGIRNLIFAGTTTDCCVSTSIREANDRAFDCLLVADAAAATSDYLHESTLRSIEVEGGVHGATATLDNVLLTLKAT